MEFQFNRKTARDLPRRPVSQRNGQRLASRDLFSAEPSLSPQDGPKIVNDTPLRQKLGRPGVNEFAASQRGSAAASQVKYASGASTNNTKAVSREELLKRREALKQRLAAQGKTASPSATARPATSNIGSKIPGRLPSGGTRSASTTSARPTPTRPSPIINRVTPRTTVKPKTRGALKREELLMKGLWIFFGVLFFRLIFMENGVIDFYKMETALEYKSDVYKNLIEENKELVSEIKMIQTDANYQKKLAREHLGVIDQDEFLILFAGPKESKAKL